MARFSRGALGRRSVAKQIERAAAVRRDGDAPGAVDLLAEVLVDEPDNVAANAEMGRALRILGDPAGAEEHLRKAVSEVLDYQLVVELAQAVVEQGRVEESEELLSAALAMAAGNPRLDPGEALIVRATIALAQERVDDARAALDAIVPKRATDLTKRYADVLRARIDSAG